MANLRLFETPIQATAKLNRVFPVLDQILKEYCKSVSFWKVYTVNHTTVILVENNVERVVVLANQKTPISKEEIAFIQGKLMDESKDTSIIYIPEDIKAQYEEAYKTNYKSIIILKQYII